MKAHMTDKNTNSVSIKIPRQLGRTRTVYFERVFDLAENPLAKMDLFE